MKTGIWSACKPASARARRLGFLCAVAYLALASASAGYSSFQSKSNQIDLPPNTLWEVVHNVCVPAQNLFHDPKPCVRVELTGGLENGFAIVRDPRGGAQFLLVPTVRISGIESPIVRAPDAPNYFAMAWDLRTMVSDALRLPLTRDDMAMAINSAVSRSQDQLHIHFSCVRADVAQSLHRNQKRIRDQWTAFNEPLYGRYYLAMWISGENLGANNPFRYLEELPESMRNLQNLTLVVVGFTRTDGSKGFVLLADQVHSQLNDLANGEELLDHDCEVAGKRN